MPKSILIVIAVFFVSFCRAQLQYLDLSKRNLITRLDKIEKRDNVKTTITQTDSSVVFLIRNSSVRDVDMIFSFDKEGVCVSVPYIRSV